MRNTLIPLDMIFIDARGEVRHVHPMARPLDETSVPGAPLDDPAPERLMVLEIRGGDAARLGIHPGMVLSHPGLPQDGALAPCD
ncbi:putative ACR [compost metagenome]